jgi:hypothetical protein
MHNIKCKAVARFVLPQAAAGQVYTSKHYACSGLNGAIISDVVWKVEALRAAVSRICIVVGGEDQLILWWAYQTVTGTSRSKRIYWRVGKKGNAERANK